MAIDGVTLATGYEMLANTYHYDMGILFVLARATQDDDANNVHQGDIVSLLINNTHESPGWVTTGVHVLSIGRDISTATIQATGAAFQILTQEGDLIKHYESWDCLQTVQAKQI